MNILVTGGAGFIGSSVARALIAQGHEVVIVDNLVRGHREAVPQGTKFIQADVGDTDTLRAVLRNHKIEAVMHFAAFIEAGESMQRPGEFFDNNTGKTARLLNAMVAEGVTKLIFSSTAAVYQSKDTPLKETDPLEPASAYGDSKLMVERMLRRFHEAHGIQFVALRYFNAVGPGENHTPETHLIPLVFQVPEGKRNAIYIYGKNYPTPDGTCIRDYTYIDDLVHAHVLALDKVTRFGGAEVFNVGTGEGASVLQVVDYAREVTGHEIPAIDHDPRAGDAAILVADATKFEEEFGWRPQTGLRTILENTWQWRKEYFNGHHGHGVENG